MRVLVLNAGSSSLKVSLVDADEGDRVLADEVRRCQRLQSGHVACAREHDVRVAIQVGARPLPDPHPARAVRDRIVHGEVVERGLLARDDHVDVVVAAEAVVRHREQAVRVRREVHADDLRLLVHHVIDEAWILVREAVVVLSPHV